MNIIVRLMADGLIVVLFVVAIYMMVRHTPAVERFNRYSRVFLAGLLSYMSAKVIAALWQPQQLRPFELEGATPGATYLDNPGFPSDHMLFAVFLVLAVYYCTRNRYAATLFGVLAILIGVGRILAGVHTPLDVAGGVVFAFVGTLMYINKPLARSKSTS